MSLTPNPWQAVADEMRAALDKHGPRYMGNLTDRALMLAVLTEEVGEVARHVCDGTDWRDEMEQVAAMAMAALGANPHDLATMDALEVERDRLAAYIGSRDFDNGCICDVCVRVITKRLECADELLAAAREATAE